MSGCTSAALSPVEGCYGNGGVRGVRGRCWGRNNRLEKQTRSSWLNCALRDDEAMYWVSIGHYEAVAVGN